MLVSSKRMITDMAFVLLNLTMTIMSCFLLGELPRIVRVIAVLLFLLLCILVPTVSDGSKSAYRLLLTISVFMAVILLGYISLHLSGGLSYFKDFDRIKEFILSTKQWGVIVYLAIVLLQVLVLPIPGAITILIGVAIYGPFWSFVLSTIATFVGSVIAFFTGRTFGKRLVSWMCGAEKTDKYARLLGEKGKAFFILMMLFPFFPDDILCMVAGISRMSTRFFIISILITRTFTIGFTAFLGSGEIIPFRGWGIPVWLGIFAATIIVFVVISIVRRNIENSKFGNRHKRN